MYGYCYSENTWNKYVLGEINAKFATSKSVILSKIELESTIESGGPGESHPQAPTEPCVNLSIHTAPTSHTLETSRFQADSERNPVPPSYLVDHLLL